MFVCCLPPPSTFLAASAGCLSAARGGFGDSAVLQWLEEGFVAWQGMTLDSDLAGSLRSACCLMRLRQL